MQRSCSLVPRVAMGAAITLVLLLALPSFGSADNATVLAIEATPSPFIFITPTPTGQAGIATTPGPAGIVQPAAATSPSVAQQTSDQIASISAQVTQAMQDSTLSADARVQRINLLATQFNQLVAQWQQQIAQNPALTGATLPTTCVSAPCPPQPTPGAATLVPATPTPLATPAVSPGGLTADQLRAQIAAISQQMATVSHDSTLSADVRNVQLSALSTQFNQLMLQLQQVGG